MGCTDIDKPVTLPGLFKLPNCEYVVGIDIEYNEKEQSEKFTYCVMGKRPDGEMFVQHLNSINNKDVYKENLPSKKYIDTLVMFYGKVLIEKGQ